MYLPQDGAVSPHTGFLELALTTHVCFAVKSVLTPSHLQINTEQKVPSRQGDHQQATRRTSSVGQDGVNLNREQDGIMGGTYRMAGNLWLTVLNGEHWLGQTSDLAVTLSGVCLCAFWTTLLYHLL